MPRISKSHPQHVPDGEPVFTEAQIRAIEKGWTTPLAVEHSRGEHHQPGWFPQAGCLACRLENLLVIQAKEMMQQVREMGLGHELETITPIPPTS